MGNRLESGLIRGIRAVGGISVNFLNHNSNRGLMQYIVLANANLSELVAMVNDHLAKGWNCLGGVAVSTVYDTDINTTLENFFQSMTKAI